MKDKRTKEQILKLLDRAIEQEERLAEKIKTLENELADCLKKAEDPRHELTEEAMPASKVSFRIDYYRTSEEGPLKGIIEHLPSRQNKPFEGEGQMIISHFMSRFLTEETGTDKKQKTLVEENSDAPDVFAEGEKEKKVIEEIAPLQSEEIITTGSELLQRLREKFAMQNQSQTAGEQPLEAQQTAPLQRSARIERLLSKAKTPPPPPPPAQQKKPLTQSSPPSTESKTTTPTSQHRSRLLERILEEHRKNLKP